MATAAPRTEVDLARPTARPVLAFVLALLAIPGTTAAWDLPAGGLWIGLPLCVAAIVLGVRARAAGRSRGLATAAIVIAGLCLAQMVVWTLVSALS